MNPIIDATIHTTTGEELDITEEIERYMGPDQLYQDYSHLIKVRHVIPKELINQFKHLVIMDAALETKELTSLDQLLFEKTNHTDTNHDELPEGPSL